MLEPAEIFTLFFVTLGPLKLLGPFTQRVHQLSDSTVHQIAWRAFAIATVAVIAGGLLGEALAAKWHVSAAMLMLAGGIVFFLVALKVLMAQYEPAAPMLKEPLPASPLAAACSLLFPVVLTPYGIAVVIALLARSDSIERTATILAILVLVMVLDLIAMWFSRSVFRLGFIPIILQVVGAILAVLQVALSIEFILRGLKALNVIAG